MLRSASIFLAAILLPSLVLAWLAVRSAQDQQVLLEHQQAIISQDVTDGLAKTIRTQIDSMRSEFVQVTQDLLSKSASPQSEAEAFDGDLRGQWPPATVGFAVDLRGNIYSPRRSADPAANAFREENDRFLSNRENVEVYSSLNSQSFAAKTKAVSELAQAAKEQNSGLQKSVNIAPPPDQTAAESRSVPPLPASVTTMATPSAAPSAPGAATGGDMLTTDKAMRGQGRAVDQAPSANAPLPTDALSITTPAEPAPVADADTASRSPTTVTTATTPSAMSEFEVETTPPAKALFKSNNQIERQVSPQNNFNPQAATLSNTVPEESDFRRLIGTDSSGAIARFLDDKLQLMLWFRPSATSDLVFGAQLSQGLLLARLRAAVQAPEWQERERSLDISYLSRSRTPSYCVALLDDTGRPVAQSISGFTADWKHPFVATEIGETLPHWEAALYLTDPAQMSKSAHTLRLTLGLIVLLLVVAIVAGGSLIANDLRRQMRAAHQKTDFVSNVSHELKTPLTSIRMFADLLAEGRVTEPERQLTYLKIISAESARLTRLINNVLDFARQERGAPAGERRPCDLVEITRGVVETCLPHLEAAGQHLACEIEAEALPIVGDRDALAQIVLNLISNAEKYGGGEITVRIRRQETTSGALGCVDVLDRGPGIPPREVEAVFLPFHRLHNSLSSGIPGSGLGLTLARRMARVHGGDIAYSARAGGGSCFTLTIPLNPSK